MRLAGPCALYTRTHAHTHTHKIARCFPLNRASYMISRARTTEGGLSTRARAALFYQTNASMGEAMRMSDADITFDLLLRSGVREVNCLVAGLGPKSLKERGAPTARSLRNIGFDSISLCHADLCNEAVLAFGAADVVDAFVTSATDAVCIAGKEAMHILGVDATKLLSLCAGCPGEALEVLQQLPRGVALDGVPASALLDAGLRASSLSRAGYGFATVVAHVNPSPSDLYKLGYAQHAAAMVLPVR